MTICFSTDYEDFESYTSRILAVQRPTALSQDMPRRSWPDIETIGQVKRTLNTMPFSLCIVGS